MVYIYNKYNYFSLAKIINFLNNIILYIQNNYFGLAKIIKQFINNLEN